MKDIILSLSGGLDSGSLLFEYQDRIALAVSFNYGSNHAPYELAAAKKMTRILGIPHRIIDMRESFKGFKSALLAGSDAVPSEEYNENSIKADVVPFRNAIFLSVLAGIADSTEGVKYIALATHSGEHDLYPDCTPEFSDAMSKAISLGTEHHIEFFRPYIHINKREVAKRGIAHGLNPDWTYSCYKGVFPPCGVCATCREREEALRGLTW